MAPAAITTIETVAIVVLLGVAAVLNRMVIILIDKIPPMVMRSLNDYLIYVQLWVGFIGAASQILIEIGLAITRVHQQDIIFPLKVSNLTNNTSGYNANMLMDVCDNNQTRENTQCLDLTSENYTKNFVDYETYADMSELLKNDSDKLQSSLFHKTVCWSESYLEVIFIAAIMSCLRISPIIRILYIVAPIRMRTLNMERAKFIICLSIFIQVALMLFMRTLGETPWGYKTQMCLGTPIDYIFMNSLGRTRMIIGISITVGINIISYLLVFKWRRKRNNQVLPKSLHFVGRKRTWNLVPLAINFTVLLICLLAIVFQVLVQNIFETPSHWTIFLAKMIRTTFVQIVLPITIIFGIPHLKKIVSDKRKHMICWKTDVFKHNDLHANSKNIDITNINLDVHNLESVEEQDAIKHDHETSF